MDLVTVYIINNILGFYTYTFYLIFSIIDGKYQEVLELLFVIVGEEFLTGETSPVVVLPLSLISGKEAYGDSGNILLVALSERAEIA